MSNLPPRLLASFAFAGALFGQNFKPDDVKVLGDLKYGQTSTSVECATSYCAFVFDGNGEDRIEANVKGVDGTTFVAIADGSLTQLSSSTNRVVLSLPNHGPDAEAFYIVFCNDQHKPTRFVVALKKLPR